VNSLHRGDDAEAAEAWDVGGVDVLRVLDAPAEVLFVGMRLEGLLEDVERFAIGAVADGVDAELVAVLNGELGGLADVGGIVGVEAGGIGLVVVGGEEPGAARAEGAVDGPLDAADREVVAARADGAVAARRAGRCRRGASSRCACGARAFRPWP
jgi:hypothetical protein